MVDVLEIVRRQVLIVGHEEVFFCSCESRSRSGEEVIIKAVNYDCFEDVQ